MTSFFLLLLHLQETSLLCRLGREEWECEVGGADETRDHKVTIKIKNGVKSNAER